MERSGYLLYKRPVLRKGLGSMAIITTVMGQCKKGWVNAMILTQRLGPRLKRYKDLHYNILRFYSATSLSSGLKKRGVWTLWAGKAIRNPF